MGTTSKIQVTLANQLSMPSPTCTLSGLSGIAASATCAKAGQVITVNSPFTTGYTGGVALQFTINDIMMPGNTGPTSDFTLATYLISGAQAYTVDQIITANLVQATPGSLTNTQVVPGTLLAYATTSFTFSLAPTNDIPIDGKLRVGWPAQMSVPDVSITENSCSAVALISTSLTCAVDTANRYITVSNGFPAGFTMGTGII